MLRTPRSELSANTKTMRRKGRFTPSPTAQRYTPAHSRPHEKKEMAVPTRSGLVPRSSFDAPWKSLRCGARRFTSGSFERTRSAAREALRAQDGDPEDREDEEYQHRPGGQIKGKRAKKTPQDHACTVGGAFGNDRGSRARYRGSRDVADEDALQNLTEFAR